MARLLWRQDQHDRLVRLGEVVGDRTNLRVGDALVEHAAVIGIFWLNVSLAKQQYLFDGRLEMVVLCAFGPGRIKRID